MNRLKLKYQQEVLPKLQKEFKHDNAFAVAQIKKVVVNMGIAHPIDPKAREKVVENVVEQFKVITGQQPQVTKAAKAIAGFKLRAGDPLGVMVTLRGENMWELLDKLVSITLPRVKDFRGISLTAFDGQGNYSLGLEEQIVFPEINYDQIESIRSLQINIITSIKDDQEARRMLELLGFPFEKKEEK
ncbi:MAG: 50S ribosomal protein L5 [Candidatus Pacebacteria bacterium RIFOXYB1_FULL_39_46]|nr:MAG: 50S ribosomal protein L5 [Candidatus Pacebacteria bacterium RIFOXYB1_FULL_39_46]OGJ39015.1 MAG: 50S ribosomal protein L5 [Candidatus Pacebacteria bacterium RIFOXYA1_FULL_38_18]OGJ39986.1 MAG: 50S ribosomal protein L5 [Candidatus Pacebacteria bacterium RIFOXYD1_FULL_39_27]OGJ40752.1 MAG: 50S ribosomal protein L5 [Candidatus Pacebacteria bacterium RIFOXYC1_FULL_39_21]